MVCTGCPCTVESAAKAARKKWIEGLMLIANEYRSGGEQEGLWVQ